MESKEYQFYSSEDFALDENFQNWVLHPNMKNNYFWTTWLKEHPQKEETINKAIVLVRSIKFRSYKLSDNEKEQLLDSIRDKIDHEEDHGEGEILPQPSHVKKIFTWQRWWKYAAAVVIGILIAFGISRINESPSDKTISFNSHAGFGEVKKMILPDSSEVILNANSKLIYSEKSGKDREVWIDGEAFFVVRHTFDNKKFIVHTYNNISVEVLGTRFNVNTRAEKIVIVLQKGSIKLHLAEGADNRQTQLYLNPGEMFSYNKQSGDYTKGDVDASLYDSWASGKLVMNNYSLSDAVKFFQEVFDKKLIIKNRQLTNNKISGSIPIVYNIDTMLVQFGKAFQVHFHHHENDIWVEK